LRVAHRQGDYPHPPSSGGTGRRERLLPRRLWPDPASPPPACRLRLPLRSFPPPKSFPLGFSPRIKAKETFFRPRSTLPFKSLPSGLQPPSNSKIFSGKSPSSLDPVLKYPKRRKTKGNVQISKESFDRPAISRVGDGGIGPGSGLYFHSDFSPHL